MEMPLTIVQEIKNEFQGVLNALRSSKVFENKLNELLKDVQENNAVISHEISKIQLFFDKLNNFNFSAFQKTLEDRDEYKFKAESLEQTLSHLQKELCHLKSIEGKPNYTDKELDFLHQENSKLLTKEKNLQEQISKYKGMEVQLNDCKKEIEFIKKRNIEKQTKLIDKDVEYQQKSAAYESIILRQKEEIKKLSDELKDVKAEILFVKESQPSTQCEMKRTESHVEVVSTCHVEQEETVEVQQRRPHRKRKEVNYREIEETIPRVNGSKQSESSENGSSSNKTQKKRIRNKKVQLDEKLLSSKVLEEQDGKAATVEDDMNIQNMDPNIEELAIRRVASENKLFKKPTAPKKRNLKKNSSVLTLDGTSGVQNLFR